MTDYVEKRAGRIQRAVSWADRRHIVSVRSAVLGVTVWLTTYVTFESFKFAYASTLPGIELAAVIASITAPVCALQGFVFNSYMRAKDGNP